MFNNKNSLTDQLFINLLNSCKCVKSCHVYRLWFHAVPAADQTQLVFKYLLYMHILQILTYMNNVSKWIVRWLYESWNKPAGKRWWRAYIGECKIVYWRGNGGCKEWICVLVTSFFSFLNISYIFQASH